MPGKLPAVLMASKAGLVEFCQKVYSLDVRGVWAGAFSCTRGIKKCQTGRLPGTCARKEVSACAVAVERRVVCRDTEPMTTACERIDAWLSVMTSCGAARRLPTSARAPTTWTAAALPTWTWLRTAPSAMRWSPASAKCSTSRTAITIPRRPASISTTITRRTSLSLPRWALRPSV